MIQENFKIFAESGALVSINISAVVLIGVVILFLEENSLTVVITSFWDVTAVVFTFFGVVVLL